MGHLLNVFQEAQIAARCIRIWSEYNLKSDFSAASLEIQLEISNSHLLHYRNLSLLQR